MVHDAKVAYVDKGVLLVGLLHGGQRARGDVEHESVDLTERGQEDKSSGSKGRSEGEIEGESMKERERREYRE